MSADRHRDQQSTTPPRQIEAGEELEMSELQPAQTEYGTASPTTNMTDSVTRDPSQHRDDGPSTATASHSADTANANGQPADPSSQPYDSDSDYEQYLTPNPGESRSDSEYLTPNEGGSQTSLNVPSSSGYVLTHSEGGSQARSSMLPDLGKLRTLIGQGNPSFGLMAGLGMTLAASDELLGTLRRSQQERESARSAGREDRASQLEREYNEFYALWVERQVQTIDFLMRMESGQEQGAEGMEEHQ